MLHHKTDLSVGPIPDHFRRLAIPSAIGMVFAILYSLVDTFFAGLLSTDALAALAMSLPVFFLLTSAGLGMNAALVSLVGYALGNNSPERAKQLACQGLSYAAIFSVLLVPVGFALATWMVNAVTEPGSLRVLTIAYLNVLLLSIPAFLMFFAANGILMVQGSAIIIMRAQVASFLANLVLNPLMIFGIPGLVAGIGFNGIAISTLVSQTGAMVYILRWVLRSELMRGGAPPTYRPILQDFRVITTQAIPVSVAMALAVFSPFIVQLYLKDFGPEALAAYGVVIRIEQILVLPGLALTLALRAIVAQNYGAAQYDRIRVAFTFCCKSGVAFMLVGSLLLWVGGRSAIGLFTNDPEVVRIGGDFVTILGFLLPFYVLIFTLNGFLQALQHSAWVLWINGYYRILATAFFTGVFVVVWDMATWGIWFGIATSTLTGFLFALSIAVMIARKEIGGLFRN